MPQYFQRIVRTSVSIPGTGTSRGWVSWDPITGENGIRQAFHVEKTKSSEPNKSEVQIWGLSDDSIALLSDRDAVLTVEAGYNRLENLSIIAIGDIEHVDVKDRVVKVEAADGSRKYKLSRIATSYASSVSMKSLVGIFAEQMDLKVRFPIDVTDIQLTQGGTFVGPVSEHMDSITKSLGLTWSIQDDVLQLVKEGQDTGERAVVLGPRSGLIGVPSKNVKNKTVEFKALLQPELKPNRIVNLKPRQDVLDFEGFYRCIKLVHQGDSGFDQPFYTDIEGKKL